MDYKKVDPKNLILEAYNIVGIGSPECRSIFLDWALSVSSESEISLLIQLLINKYEGTAKNHPMTRVLYEGLLPTTTPKRSGGRKARLNLIR
ncbi:MAG: hypothetical protein ACI8Y9_000944 [Paracoccaceae bacterium]|jgi:hypothetical protein